ncbi:hypothetical protein [Actinoplanes sp. GCM10030250]|uniref:hypothetical protein n=1 Tax=Actinoplanes sp. GCM10030250 TaxID=3273376 RepID=UPI00361A9680
MTTDRIDNASRNETQRDFTKNPGLLFITTSLRLLMLRLDRLRDLVEIVRKDKAHNSTKSLRHLEKRIDFQERIAIEIKVRGLANSRQDRIDALLAEKHGIVPDKSKGREFERYPLAAEQVFAFISTYSEKVDNDIWEELEATHSSDEVKLEYASNYYASILQPDLAGELAASIFPRAVQQFNSVLGGLARTALTVSGAESLGDLPDIPWAIQKSLGKYPNDIERWAIDRRVENFVRGGIDEWRDTSLRFAEFDVEDATGSWHIIQEAIARMRLLDRASDGTVDAEYLADAGPLAPPEARIWGRLKTSGDYLSDLLDNIESLALSMALLWSTNFFNDHDSDINFFIDRAVDLESRGRWTSALGIFQTLRDTYVHPEHPSFSMTMINIWLCRQQLGTDDDAMRNSIKISQTAEPVEQAGLCALTRDWPGMLAAIEEACEGESASFTANWLMQMPLMQRAMKENPQVRRLLERKKSASTKRRLRK